MKDTYNNFIEIFENNKQSSGIQKSFETLQKTDTLRYLDELYNKEYVIVDKAYFSKNLMYIPNRFVIAYKDIIDIVKLSGINEYEIIMVDGSKYHLCMKKITVTELCKHINSEIVQKLNRKTSFSDKLIVGLYLIILFIIFYFINR